MSDVSQVIAWAGLATLCTFLSWHRAEAIIGLTLLLCSMVTSAAYFGSSFESRLVLEVCQGLCVTVAARAAFQGSRSAWSAAIVMLAAFDVALAGALSWSLTQSAVTVRFASIALAWGANCIYALQCLLVGAPGIYDVVSRGILSRNSDRRVDHASGARDVAHKRDGSRP